MGSRGTRTACPGGLLGRHWGRLPADGGAVGQAGTGAGAGALCAPSTLLRSPAHLGRLQAPSLLATPAPCRPVPLACAHTPTMIPRSVVLPAFGVATHTCSPPLVWPLRSDFITWKGYGPVVVDAWGHGTNVTRLVRLAGSGSTSACPGASLCPASRQPAASAPGLASQSGQPFVDSGSLMAEGHEHHDSGSLMAEGHEHHDSGSPMAEGHEHHDSGSPMAEGHEQHDSGSPMAEGHEHHACHGSPPQHHPWLLALRQCQPLLFSPHCCHRCHHCCPHCCRSCGCGRPLPWCTSSASSPTTRAPRCVPLTSPITLPSLPSGASTAQRYTPCCCFGACADVGRCSAVRCARQTCAT